MTVVPRRILAGVLLATATVGHVAVADEMSAADGSARAAELVASMSRALLLLDYEGTFVHIRGMSVSSMHILHASDELGEMERMISLDGEAREVIRDHSLVTCIWPGSQSVVVSKSRPRKLLPQIDISLASNDNYRLDHVGVDRVAGIDTEVVAITPIDQYRYGYRFWIDRETHMLLRSKLLDGQRVVEQVMFTAIDYPDAIDRSRFEISLDTARMSWVDAGSGARALAGLDARAGADSGAVPAPPSSARATSGLLPFEGRAEGVDGTARGSSPAAVAGVGAVGVGTAGDGNDVDRVRFEQLPGGYMKLSESHRPMALGGVPFDDTGDRVGDDGPMVSHVMVSDGMASVSVYVEHLAAREQDTSATGMSSMGAVNAYGLSLERGYVTVVGEVPPATVRRIAEAVRLVE